jgi:hypothetical protein
MLGLNFILDINTKEELFMGADGGLAELRMALHKEAEESRKAKERAWEEVRKAEAARRATIAGKLENDIKDIATNLRAPTRNLSQKIQAAGSAQQPSLASKTATTAVAVAEVKAAVEQQSVKIKANTEERVLNLQVKLDTQTYCLELLAASPENLHRIVQTGDIPALKFLLGIASDAPLSRVAMPIASAAATAAVIAGNRDHKDYKYSSPTSTAAASATLGSLSAFASLTIKRDLHGMSFILIAEEFREHQIILQAQGALFTVEQLEQKIEEYLRSPLTPNNERYLKQLHADINLLLQAWQSDQLTNKEARAVLDARALEQLLAQQKTLPQSLLEPVSEHIKSQQQKLLDIWQASQCDEKNHPGLQRRLVRELTKVCQVMPEEKYPLTASIQQQQKILLQERFCAKQLPDKALNAYRQLLCGLLLDTTISDNPTQALLPSAEKEVLEHAFASEFEHCKQKADMRIIRYPLPRIAAAFCQLSMNLALNDIMPPNENVARAELLQATIERLLQQFHARKLAKETADNLVQEVTRLIIGTITLEQQRAGFVWLLAEWKAGRLSAENQKTLTDLLTKQWQELQQKMRRQFDPTVNLMAQLATLEAMVQRLLQSPVPASPASNLNDAKSQPPPTVAAAPVTNAGMSQLLVSNSGVGFSSTATVPLAGSQLEGVPFTLHGDEGSPQPISGNAPTPQQSTSEGASALRHH